MYNTQLDTFIHVVDTGSFAKAAKVLYISTTAVIKQINQLEDRLGVKLLVRSPRGIKLTEAGKVFYPDAKRIIALSEEAVAKVRRVQGEPSRIRIGTSVLTAKRLLQAITKAARESDLNVRIEMVPFENAPDVSSDILSNLGKKLDIVVAMCETSEERSYAVQPLSYEPLCVGVSYNNPLARKERLEVEDLYGRNLLIFQRGFNSDIDLLRDELEQNHPEVKLTSVPFMDMRIFNHCENSSDMMMAIEKWQEVHPMLRIIPVNWDFKVPYGLLYSHSPSHIVQAFVDMTYETFREIVEAKETIK